MSVFPIVARPVRLRYREEPPLASADSCPYTDTGRFDWDPRTAAANLRSHGVSFAEAATVLEDDSALTREDPFSHGESRFVTPGLSSFANLPVVVYTYREPDVIRVIPAWKASKRQRETYEEGGS